MLRAILSIDRYAKVTFSNEKEGGGVNRSIDPVGGEVSLYWGSAELKVEGIATLGSQALSVLELFQLEDFEIDYAAYWPPHSIDR
jgi:hypothetical protein